MDANFINQANIKRNEYLLKTEDLFTCNRKTWSDSFAVHFEEICANIWQEQDKMTLSAISYLEYTMLYTNFINRRYFGEVRIYGDESYLDINQRIIGEYDISFIFIYFDKLWEDLFDLKRRYVGKISAQDVTTYMLQALPDFYSYFVNTARLALRELCDKTPFIDVIKSDAFMINVGDYMAKTETIYTERKNKDAVKYSDWFSKRLQGEYVFGDFSNLDFSRGSFFETDFRYAQFRNSTLCNTSFAGSCLTGSDYRNAKMDECCLDYCAIYEADFSNASLKKASLVSARADEGLTNKAEWQFVGYLPVSFRNADLSGADFTDAYLSGADFTGAILTNTVFTNTVLDNAVFSTRIAQLSDEQSRRIKVKESSGLISKDDKKTPGVLRTPITVETKMATNRKKSIKRYSSFFVLEQLDNAPSISSPRTTEVQKMPNTKGMEGFDYFARRNLVSEKLKNLFALYMPGYNFELAAYMGQEKKDVTPLWLFDPPANSDFHANYRTDGYVSHITPLDKKMPFIFTARSPKGIRSIVVQLAVAESMLRRSIFGVKLTRLLEFE